MLLIWDNTPEGSSLSHALPFLENYLTNGERLGILNKLPDGREGILARARGYRRRFLDTIQPFPNFGLEVQEDRIHLVVDGSVAASWSLQLSEQHLLPVSNDAPKDNCLRSLVGAMGNFIEIQALQGGPQSMNREEILTRATEYTDAFASMLEPCPPFSLVAYEDRIDVQVLEGVCATWRRQINADHVQATFENLLTEEANQGKERDRIAAKIRSLEQVAMGYHNALISGDKQKMSQALLMFVVDTCELLVLARRLLDNANVTAIFDIVAEPSELTSMVSRLIETDDRHDRYNDLIAFMQSTCVFFSSIGSFVFVEDLVTQFMDADNPADAQRYVLAFMRETRSMFVWLLRRYGRNP